MAKKKNRKQQQLIVTAAVVGGLAVIVGVMVAMQLGGGPPPVAKAEVNPAEKPAALADATSEEPQAKASETLAPAGPTLVADDGRTLWASPTAGEPLSLAYLPSGCRLILSIRPAAMLQTTDGRIVLEQFSRSLAKATAELRQATGLTLRDLERLTIGVRPGETMGSLDVTIVAEMMKPTSSPDGSSAKTLSKNVRRFSPNHVVAAAPATLAEITSAEGEPPPLRRELEQLVVDSDGDRHASLLVAPSFLFADGKTLFAGEVEALRDPLFEQLPDDVRGVLVTAHWLEDHFYWEIRAASAAETTATQLSALLGERMMRWPTSLQMSLLDLNPAPYGRRVVASLPGMTQLLTQYARRGVEGRHAVINGYLPPTAGHNLLLAGELMVAQLSGGGGGAPRQPTGATPPAAQTAEQRLGQPATVSFARDTLEMAVRYLSDEIDVPIVILGGDLQLEGITKNQSFALDVQDKSGQAVLLEILTKANPDKTATGPEDPKQKLVYVIKPDDTGAETIYVTTRASAAKRGDQLPTVFEP